MIQPLEMLSLSLQLDREAYKELGFSTELGDLRAVEERIEGSRLILHALRGRLTRRSRGKVWLTLILQVIFHHRRGFRFTHSSLSIEFDRAAAMVRKIYPEEIRRPTVFSLSFTRDGSFEIQTSPPSDSGEEYFLEPLVLGSGIDLNELWWNFDAGSAGAQLLYKYPLCVQIECLQDGIPGADIAVHATLWDEEKTQEMPLKARYRFAQLLGQVDLANLDDGSSSTLAGESQGVDLELQITTVRDAANTFFRYELHSSNHKVGVFHERYDSPPHEKGQSASSYQEYLFDRLEKLHHSKDIDCHPLKPEEVDEELKILGHQLSRELVPRALQLRLLELSSQDRTLLIVSDESWVPWELIKLDGGDFLAAELQVTRWLGGTPLRPGGKVARWAGFEIGEPDSQRKASQEPAGELMLLGSLGVNAQNSSPDEATYDAFKTLMSNDGVDLLHFAGHGELHGRHPSESAIWMKDRYLRAKSIPEFKETIASRRPLVFLNACQAARQGPSLTRLGGWVQSWVKECECGGFVGPQWSVATESAARFAEVFYSALAEAKTLGEATLAARLTLRSEGPGRLEWLAYAIYGDPKGRWTFPTSAG